VREIEKQRKGIKETAGDQDKHAFSFFWHRQQLEHQRGDNDMFAEFYEDTLHRFQGDKVKTMQYIESLKNKGALQQILAANKFDLKEMITDRKQFIKQLNGQFGGANVNDLISMQLDEFKVKGA